VLLREELVSQRAANSALSEELRVTKEALEAAHDTLTKSRERVASDKAKREETAALFAKGVWPDNVLEPFAAAIREDLRKLVNKDRRSPFRNSLKALSEYSSEDWLQSRLDGCPALVQLLLAVIPLSGPFPEKEGHRRRTSVVTALDAILRGASGSWLSPVGLLSSWVLHSVTQSELAVKLLNGVGFGAPSQAPQKEAFKSVGKALAKGTPVFKRNSDLAAYGDNTGNGYHKTTRMRCNGKLWVPITTAIEGLHLVDDQGSTAGTPRLQTNPDLHPEMWNKRKLNAAFHTTQVGDRAAILAEFETASWRHSLEQAKLRERERPEQSGQVPESSDPPAKRQRVVRAPAPCATTVFPKSRPPTVLKKERTLALTWTEDGQPGWMHVEADRSNGDEDEELATESEEDSDVPPAGHCFLRDMMPCMLVNPQPTASLKPILVRMLEHGEVAGFTGDRDPERLWILVGLDGALYLRSKEVVEKNDELQGVALISALGHESWSYDGAILSVMQPLVGKSVLEGHCGHVPSLALQRAMLNNADKHKTRDFMLLMQSCLQEELCRHFLLDPSTPSPESEECTVESLQAWLAEVDNTDKTLTVVKHLVKLLQHRDLFHWALRYNSAAAMGAARAGSLMALLHARGRHQYAKIAPIDMSLYGNPGHGEDDFALAPAAVRDLVAKFMTGGLHGFRQPVDLLHEQAQRKIHLAGKGTSAEASLGITALYDTSTTLRAKALAELQIKERDDRPRAELSMKLDRDRMLKILETSQFLRSGGKNGERTAVQDHEGSPMAESAADLERYGQSGLDAFAAAVTEGEWRSYTVQPRLACTVEEAAHDWKKTEKKAAKAAAAAAAKEARQARRLAQGGALGEGEEEELEEEEEEEDDEETLLREELGLPELIDEF